MVEIQTQIVPFIVAILIGGLVGVERERKKQASRKMAATGIRTSIFVSLLGAMSAYFSQQFGWNIFIVSLIGLLTFISISHWYLTIQYKRIGITTEVSSVLLFLYGALCTIGQVQLAVILGILTALLLSLRSYLHGAVKKLSDRELYDTIKFAIIAFIILPFLPDQSFDQQILSPFMGIPQSELHGSFQTIDVLNPYRIWFLVVFVSGINFVGYILVKLFGEKLGIALSGLMGGLYSSTATSLTLANESKNSPRKSPFIAGIVFACAISFIKSFLFIRTLNEELFTRVLIPLFLMFAYLAIAGLYYLFRSKKPAKKSNPVSTLSTPFSLKSALKLGSFIVAALLIAKISLSLAGVELYYVIATLSAFFAVDDPIVISTAASAGNLLDMEHAKNIILLVTYLNMVQKVFIIHFFGNRKLVKPLAIIFGGLLLVTFAGFIYL
ncbi:MAG: DUF4010 domain-containing protein [Candidatus Gracilibacteria bacterium]